MRHIFLANLDTKIQTIFATDTNGNFLAMDPDNLTFVLKKELDTLVAFLKLYRMLYSSKINICFWSQNTVLSESDQKFGLCRPPQTRKHNVITNLKDEQHLHVKCYNSRFIFLLKVTL
jgi:hypothetical protein